MNRKAGLPIVAMTSQSTGETSAIQRQRLELVNTPDHQIMSTALHPSSQLSTNVQAQQPDGTSRRLLFNNEDEPSIDLINEVELEIHSEAMAPRIRGPLAFSDQMLMNPHHK